MKIRLKYTKTGVLKYVGHLDLLRLFQKAFRRADLPMSYSQGFNPHQIISIGAPLAIGVTSVGEYIDIEIEQPISKEDAISRINETMPEGLKIIDWIEQDDASKSSMAIIEGGKYRVSVENWTDIEDIEEKIKAYYNQEEILITKKAKKNRMREIDIKEGIYQMDYNKQYNILTLTLATGSKLNIKPEFVLKSFCSFIGIEYEPYDYLVERIELYANIDNTFVPLDKLS